MSNTNSYREHVPNELAKELLTNSKPVAKYFNKKLNDNIDILKEEEIVNKDAPDIKNESGEIKDGKISENIIDIALYKHMASIELIKALIIAKFADKWKEVYLKYYTEKGEPNTIQNKNESNISTIDSKGKEQNEIHKSVICTFESIPFDTSKDNYNILILPFRNPEKNKEMTSLGENLAFGLIEKNNVQKLGLEIKYFSSYVDYISYKEAREIGNMYNADMVIWGNDSIQEGKSHIIYFHYVNIKGNTCSDILLEEGKTDKIEIERLIEIVEGNMQLEIDDIIYWFLGNKYYSKADYIEALAILGKIKSNKYLNEDLYFLIANCYLFLKLFIEAKKAYEFLLKINPYFHVAHFNYANILYEGFNDLKGAKKHYKIALDINPYFYEAHYNYAFILEVGFNDIIEAKKHYKIALKIDPNSVDAHNNYANLIWYKFNDFNGAKKHYEIALEIDPNQALSNYNYACLLEKIFNDHQKARQHYKIALKINPNYVDAHINYGNLLLNEYNDLKDAKKHFKIALEINPKSIEAHINYANLLKNKTEAKKHYEIALEINPNSFDVNINYATLLFNKFNDPKGAEKHFKIALKINPNNAKIHNNYALLLKENLNDIKGAKKHYEMALKIDPNCAEIYMNYAILFFDEFNDKKTAKEHYLNAIRLKPEFKTKFWDDYFEGK